MYDQATENQTGASPWQFSLRTMFVLTAGVAICCALQRIVGTAPIVIAALVSALLGTISWLDVSQSTNRRRLVIRRMLWSFGVTMVLVTACIPQFTDVRTPSRRAVCANNLRQLALSVLMYEQSHGSFPPAYIPDAKGNPMHSWRVSVLPFLGRPDLRGAYRFSESWDGPNNRKLHSQWTDLFCCPSATGKLKERTDYVAVTGPGTAWPGATGAMFKDICDPSKCILLIELPDSDIHWMEPRDISLKEALALFSKRNAKLSGHTGRINVAFADCRVESLDQNSLIQHLRAMLPPDEPEKANE